MVRARSNLSCLVIVLVAALSGSTEKLFADAPTSPTGRVTRYDVATPGDILLEHLIDRFTGGDVADLPILSDLSAYVGDWVTKFIDANQIAGIITTSMPIEGQSAVGSVDKLVSECAQTLGLAKPTVYIRSSPQVNAYIVEANGHIHLVLTSALLNLFENRPQELKFVIGHELGHALCGHQVLKRKAFGILAAVQLIDVAAVPEKFQYALPPLALGRLFTWCRESEISADRAGLLCCGEPEVAYQAMMRLLHGLSPNSTWIDPTHPDFDAQAVIKSFQDWQYQPFVKFILDLKSRILEHPYVPERVAALKAWADTGAYQAILNRKTGASQRQLIEIISIKAFELAPDGETVDPYILVLDGGQPILKTKRGSKLRAGWWRNFSSTDAQVQQPRRFSDGQPLFFEIWDANYFSDSFVGGFVIHPNRNDAEKGEQADGCIAEYRANILWDWREARTVTRPGYALVRVRILDPQTPMSGGTVPQSEVK